MHYFNNYSDNKQIEYTYFDLYDLYEKISLSNDFDESTQKLSREVIKNVDSLILYSFGGKDFKGFKESKNQLHIGRFKGGIMLLILMLLD